MLRIGKLDKNKLGKYQNQITTSTVVLTNERISHIQKRHLGDYEKYLSYLPTIIESPDYILEDKDNLETLLLLKSFRKENLQIVIKLCTNIQKKILAILF